MGKKSKQIIREDQSDLEKKIEVLEKQLEWEKLRSLAHELRVADITFIPLKNKRFAYNRSSTENGSTGHNHL